MRGYFGSVRFFKNLILLTVIILIAVPTVLSFRFGKELEAVRSDLSQTRAALDDATQSLQHSQEALEQVRAEVEAAIAAQEAAEAEQEALKAEAPAYQSLYPDFYAPQPLTANQVQDRVMYLTFDDGPTARTPEVLQILREENVKATFFVIGNESERAKQWMRDIVADGHTIGMHTYTHEYETIYDSVEAYLEDMYRIFTLIKETTGVTPTVFRFPGGSINGYNYEISQDLISEMLRRGFVPYDWNLSSGDAAAATVPADLIVSNIVNHAGGQRGVALMHDSTSKTTTVAALRPIIQQLRAKGYTFDCLTPDTKPILYSYRY